MNDIIKENIVLYWRWARFGVAFSTQVLMFWPRVWR